MKEIQGNSVLVRVSGRFALAKVRVIGSRRLYVHINFVADWKFVLKIRFSSSGFGLIKDTIAFFAQAQRFPICFKSMKLSIREIMHIVHLVLSVAMQGSL